MTGNIPLQLFSLWIGSDDGLMASAAAYDGDSGFVLWFWIGSARTGDWFLLCVSLQFSMCRAILDFFSLSLQVPLRVFSGCFAGCIYRLRLRLLGFVKMTMNSVTWGGEKEIVTGLIRLRTGLG